jgi:hypothetical protein
MPIISLDSSDWHKSMLDLQISEMDSYLKQLNPKLQEMTDEFQRNVETEAEKITDDHEKEEYYEWKSEEYWRYKETFPRIFLNSFHVAAYSLLESEIFATANKIGKKQKQVFSASDIKGGDYLVSAVYYIEKLTGIDTKTFNAWCIIKEGQRLRNIIVHMNSKVIEDKDIELSNKYGVFNKTNNEILLTDSYCNTFLGAIKSLFDELYSQIKAGGFI